MQATFSDALFCCTKAKIYFPDEPLYLVLDGTDPLECIFGVLRMKNKNASMDYLMLTHCITSMIKCNDILTMKHADWSKKGCSSRGLCLDYLSPKDWEAENLKLNDVDIRALWESGHMKARARALETGLVKSNESIDSLVLLGYTLRKPFGKMIGVTEVEVDVSMDENVNSNVPDVTEEEESVPLTDMIQNEKCPTIEG